MNKYNLSRAKKRAFRTGKASTKIEQSWRERARYNFFFMARRAIPMIAFPRVRCMFIYIYIYFLVSTYASMRCIRS